MEFHTLALSGVIHVVRDEQLLIIITTFVHSGYFPFKTHDNLQQLLDLYTLASLRGFYLIREAITTIIQCGNQPLKTPDNVQPLIFIQLLLSSNLSHGWIIYSLIN